MQIACISNKQTNNKFVCTCSLSHRRSRHTHIRLLPPPTGNGGTHTQVYHRHVMETKLSPERITFLASGNAAFLYCSKKENQPHFNLLTNMMFVCKATHTRKIYIDTHAYKHMHMYVRMLFSENNALNQSSYCFLHASFALPQFCF